MRMIALEARSVIVGAVGMLAALAVVLWVALDRCEEITIRRRR